MKYLTLLKDPKVKKLIAAICSEHYQASKNKDQNMNYLWYMYDVGTKQGDFKPFIFLSEIRLLKAVNIITEEVHDNLINMMKSEDTDNFYLVALSIIQLRTERINKLGLYTLNNNLYKNINYTKDVISPETFLTTF
jgi:hypothetical protein